MIRKAITEDFDFIYQLYMHPQVNPYLLYEPMEAESFKPIFSDLSANGIKYVYLDGEIPIGMFKLIPLTYRTAHIVYLGGLAIDPSFTGKGYGQQMMQDILSFAKAKGFKRMELGVDMINEKAMRLYEKMGFEKEGIMKKYVYHKKEDKFLDEVLMAYLF
ncbi:MAG TPA: GNAT family N-acetyltransferase [Chitinophagaceae bacterium]